MAKEPNGNKPAPEPKAPAPVKTGDHPAATAAAPLPNTPVPGGTPEQRETAQVDTVALAGGAREVDSTLPRAADTPVEKRAADQVNQQTGGKGPAPGEPRDISPMPTGGPYDPAMAGGNTTREGSPVRDYADIQARNPLRSPEEGERQRVLVPTAMTVELGPRNLPIADNEDMVVVQTSFVRDVLREKGDVITGFSGPFSGNLMRKSDWDAKKGDRLEPNPDTSNQVRL